MGNNHICPCSDLCPLQKAMDALSGKWKMSILCSLTIDGATRYNELKKKMNGISNTMLSKSLKELENDGLIKRTEYLEIPVRVEYETTEKVNTLTPILSELAAWSAKNLN
ncbi:MAG: helix-turn-helix transcriptional regulator [Oscillospiraceae bacterium]|nr:helix-turn-helix transcriptional regulator [Oscillospiraceae bacterium]